MLRKAWRNPPAASLVPIVIAFEEHVMNTGIALFCRKHWRLAAGLAVLLVAGTALLRPSAPVYALDAAPGTAFARPQFADVIADAQPAVVKIDVVKKIQGIERLAGRGPAPGRGTPFEEFFGRFGQGPFSSAPPAGPESRAAGLGSGFIVDPSGYIVTNNHVIEGAEEIKVTLADGTRRPAQLVGSDPLTDLALLRITAEQNLPAIAFGDSDQARVGDWVVAIGNPYGLGGSVTAGIISARGRDLQSGPYDDYLQIDAPINSGNSGGPVIGADGKVLGVSTAIFSPSGGNIGIGFAIPAREAAHVVGELRAHGAVERGWLGVQIQALDEAMAAALELQQTAGALVAAVVERGPAARSGIAVGDVITRFGATTIKEPRDLSRAVARAEPGSKVEIEVLRQGNQRRFDALVERNVEMPVAAAADAPGGADDAHDALGLALGPLSAEARARLALDADVEGALVVGIKHGGPADSSGLEPGDVILRVNRATVVDDTAAAQALRAARDADDPVVVLVRRGEQQFFTTLGKA